MKKERLLAKLASIDVKEPSDFPGVTFEATFKAVTNSKYPSELHIFIPYADTEFILRFLDAMGLVKSKKGIDCMYYLRSDLMLLGFKALKRKYRSWLIGRQCWLTRKSILYHPYLIEPLNPDDGTPFNIKEWQKLMRGIQMLTSK